MTKPNFIIIGAMKSATSTLHEQLALQPGIFMSTPKEPNFFSDDDVYAHGLSWYESLFSSASQDDICGESSTHYTKFPDYPHTLERMTSFLPNLKFVYVIRHPIKRLVSHYIHQWSQNVIKTDINQAINDFPELINYSLYTMQLKPYIEHYGKENILIVFSESIRAHPQQELQRVADFIGYQKSTNWYESLPEQNVSSQRVRKFKGYQVVVDNPVLATLRRNLVPQSFRDAIKRRLTMKTRPEINQEQLKHLNMIFDQELRKLADMTGSRLSLDNYNEFAVTEQISLLTK